MNNQGRKIVIDALYEVINSAPQPYQNNIYAPACPNGVNQNWANDITRQQFEIWKKYVCNILDVSYNNLALYEIMTTKFNVEQLACKANLIGQNNIPLLQLVNQIQNELFNLIRIIIQLY